MSYRYAACMILNREILHVTQPIYQRSKKIVVLVSVGGAFFVSDKASLKFLVVERIKLVKVEDLFVTQGPSVNVIQPYIYNL